MITVKASVEVSTSNRLFKKNIIRKYDGEPVITAKLITHLYKTISKEFYLKYNESPGSVSVATKIYYVSCKPSEDT